MKRDETKLKIYHELINGKSGKFQIRIPIWVYTVLENDLATYSITRDGQANMTVIVSAILASFNEYRKQEADTKLKILRAGDEYASSFYNCEIDDLNDSERLVDLAQDETVFIDRIKTILKDEESKLHEKGTVRINIHKTINNASILTSIVSLTDPDGVTITEYIKNILEWYAAKPGYRREEILCARTIKEINSLLARKEEKVPFYDVLMKKGFVVKIKPYKLVHDNDGIHNYLIGIKLIHNHNTNEFIPKTISLRVDNIESNVNTIFYLDETLKASEFSEDEKNTLESMIKNHPAFSYYSLKVDYYKLRFNKVAEDKYNQVYTQRPKYIQRVVNGDGTIDYTFDCSTRHINQYLIRLMTSFSPDEIKNAYIEILAPQGFKDNFKNYYLKFIDVIKD